MPPPPAAVVDVGGAAGAYALWLAERGYIVHLLDRTPRLVAEAQRRSSVAARPLVSCRVGDARARSPVRHGGCRAPAGPALSSHRREGPGEGARGSRPHSQPGGLLFAAAISRWASALDGLARELLTDTRFTGIVERDLRSGQHRNPTERVDYFTTAYFHRPDELASEVRSAGLELTGVFGIEGPGWILPDVVERMTDPTRREMLLRVARMLEAEPAVIGSSAHLLAVARR